MVGQQNKYQGTCVKEMKQVNTMSAFTAHHEAMNKLIVQKNNMYHTYVWMEKWLTGVTVQYVKSE